MHVARAMLASCAAMGGGEDEMRWSAAVVGECSRCQLTVIHDILKKARKLLKKVSYFATIATRLGAENGVPAPLMAHRAVTGSCSLACRPRARQAGWFAWARVAVR